MIICDRCQAPANERVIFESDDQRFDLCASCRQIALEVLTGKPEPEQQKELKPSEAKRSKKDG